ncbi:hypothetical protein F1C58_14295 [Glaciihabitans sp. INWT7]|uniref:hypothetical protein n=1 Tax=Glaciihabitans sp. INWT7 TaxID=2596912 RepID=UPI00162784CC|nr:hypothetical protein [Glaciihabitans sp. INWT7]QNE47951.1 hypothetical protein F1C58_14295 [Glaciihabitans sp. INWT7]
MNSTPAVVGAAEGLRLRFPGAWREIPLRDAAVTAEAVRRLVVESIGRADDRARLRAEVRERLLSAASAARAANADRFVIALEAVTGLPIPAFLGVYTPGLDVSAATSAAAAEVMSVVITALGALPGEDGSERYSTGESEVLVTSREDVVVPEMPPGVDIDPDEVRNLLIDFWMTVPGERRVVLLSSSSPAIDLREPLFNLYRAIVSTAEWSSS